MLPSPPTEFSASSPTGRSGFSRIAGELQLRHFIVAALVLVAAAVLAHLISLAWEKSLERHRTQAPLPPEVRTRILVIRRITTVVLWVLALGFALGQFPELRVLSAGLLASAGVSGLIVGFAAQKTLGNAVAGVVIAFSQPVRIGDEIEFRTERGVIVDITLFFAVLRLGDGKRLIIPNDVLGSEVLKNLTMGDVTRVARVEVLVPPRADAVGIRTGLLDLARAHDGLDALAGLPEIYWVRIDERGTLLRLVATCTDGPSADRLTQKFFGQAAAKVFHESA